MQIHNLEKQWVLWWRSKAISEGYVYRGRAQLREFFTDIAKGKYELIRKEVDKPD
ncbi:MAG: hypothetical protein WBB01_19880 [Phormidesmis sp.]